MGKTRRYKKRRKNSRRYKQKRCKTTRKRKRKHRRTKKQKGGLCCKYENDWKVERRLKSGNWKIEDNKGKWKAANGCGKGYSWGPQNSESNAPPFVLPDWEMKVKEPNDEYYGYKFGVLKYTPVQIPARQIAPIDGIKIGLFAHSLKHMEALGIKCYDISDFTSVIQKITEKGQWYYMTDAEPNAPKTKYTVFRNEFLKEKETEIQQAQRQLAEGDFYEEEEIKKRVQQSFEAMAKKAWAKTNYWDGKKLTPVIYTRSGVSEEENRVFTNFSDFFKNITYSKNKPHNLSQNRHGLRTCSCMYVLNEPISFTDENSNKWSQKKTDANPSNPEQQQLEGYNIAAVNLIFAKFVTKRIDENKMVLNEIDETNKNTLFLLAIEVLNKDSLEKWCAHNSSTPEANSTAKNENLSLNNISDCIGAKRQGWHLTRNNAADYRNMGTVKALSLDNMGPIILPREMQSKQTALFEKFLSNYKEKRQFLDDTVKVRPREISLFSNKEKEAKKKMLNAFEEVQEPGTFVEKAKNFNYTLRLFINAVKGRLKLKQKEVEGPSYNEQGNLPKNLKKEQQVMGTGYNIVRHSQDINPKTKILRQLSTESVLPHTPPTKGAAPPMLRSPSLDSGRDVARNVLRVWRESVNRNRKRIRMEQLINHQIEEGKDEIRQLGISWPVEEIQTRERKKKIINAKTQANIKNWEKAKQKVTDDHELYPRRMKIIQKLQTIVKALRGQYIDFYVERGVCQGPDATDRERIDEKLRTAVFDLSPYYNFVTINSNPFEINFNSPPSWHERRFTTRQKQYLIQPELLSPASERLNFSTFKPSRFWN